MKSESETIRQLVNEINALQSTIESIQWSDKAIADTKMGEHVDELSKHLDNALGRASSLYYRSVRLAKGLSF